MSVFEERRRSRRDDVPNHIDADVEHSNKEAKTLEEVSDKQNADSPDVVRIHDLEYVECDDSNEHLYTSFSVKGRLQKEV